MARIETKFGQDASTHLIDELDENKKELTKKMAQYWFLESHDYLLRAAKTRASIDSEGKKGRKENGLHKIAEDAIPPSWDETEQAWVFSFPHAGAVHQEFGATPHEIKAQKANVLAFEWPDAPQKVKEQFEHTEGDLVFFKSVDHPGIPAIGFVRHGRDKLINELEMSGIVTESVTGDEGGEES